MKTFDWHKAADILRERQPQEADAGLEEDWNWTAGCIWEGGKPRKKDKNRPLGGPYVVSSWATPVLRIHGENGEHVTIPCFVDLDAPGVKDPGWSNRQDTMWPPSARRRLRSKT